MWLSSRVLCDGLVSFFFVFFSLSGRFNWSRKKNNVFVRTFSLVLLIFWCRDYVLTIATWKNVTWLNVFPFLLFFFSFETITKILSDSLLLISSFCLNIYSFHIEDFVDIVLFETKKNSLMIHDCLMFRKMVEINFVLSAGLTSCVSRWKRNYSNSTASDM